MFGHKTMFEVVVAATITLSYSIMNFTNTIHMKLLLHVDCELLQFLKRRIQTGTMPNHAKIDKNVERVFTCQP